ncbi:MAG: hypothetical protein FD167_2328, partial [bacterium]
GTNGLNGATGATGRTGATGATGIALPFSGSVNTASDAFVVNNTGVGGAIVGIAGTGNVTTILGVGSTVATSAGVAGTANNASATAGILGVANGGTLSVITGLSAGVLGRAGIGGANSAGIVGVPASAGSLAGLFLGNTTVTGVLSKGAGTFKIDHPLDPENKFLYHSFVESPDMMNIYNGNIVTDKNGDAVVTLPDYFEALNKDFRYQLTVVGQFAQAIIADEMSNSRFTIKTDKPNVKVSWQVTGIRKDPFANANRVEVEVEKNDKERGFYLHPEVYNQSDNKAIHKKDLKEIKAGEKPE